MEKFDFEKQIKDTLYYQSEKITPSEGLLEQIHARVNAENRKERTTMKWLTSKKIIAAAAAICMFSVGCYAATRLAGVQGHSYVEYTEFSQMEKAEKKAGFDIKLIEEFSNGYTFKDAGNGESQGFDENGQAMGKKYQDIIVTYEKDGNLVSLIASNGNPSVDAGEAEPLGYNNQKYKFVPPDYVKTDEDIQKEASGELVFSYGTEEVQEQTVEGYFWKDNDLYYSLTAFDCNFGEEEMKQMSEELMQGN